MQKRLAEETILFISVAKWFVLATFIGIIVGLSTTIFLKSLNWSIDIAQRYHYYFLLLPVALLLSALIIKWLAPDAEGHGTEKVIEAVHRHSGRIALMVVPVKLLTSVITLAFGGSVGKEGPCAQIGGGLSSAFADLFRFDGYDRKKLVICGISAGFAAVFGTPIAGAMFGIEVLFVGRILYDVLLPSFIAGITSYQIAKLFGVSYFSHPLTFVPVFSNVFFVKIVVSGIIFGGCALLLIEGLKYGKVISDKLKTGLVQKTLLGGLVLVILTLIFSSQYLGLGLDTIRSSLQGEKAVWYAFILKIVFTSITLNFGGSGGIVTPIFFVGATAGSFLGHILQINSATLSAIGFVAVLAGATNTPIASSIMAIELFGPQIAPFAATACIVSFLMTGHRSVYPSQILSFRKTTSIDIDMGQEIEKTHSQLKLRSKSIVGILLHAREKIRDSRKSGEKKQK